ncbi:biotin/lipoyl-binding protein [Lujinxingia vulgaris]|uniref:Biotin/lipoyl-binding protein n=1 Tax=Lujinxingia vulgaris TaxID=2600176 RepID=A0A5C6XB38_9DELT|nr:acetyl-CoA carboxylase biotin carboxyl carrier protein subunit [Lujinxingia vulgaris]TXD36415.1 biotin/lipoyl-binding protein [Lujinxingia vulgaris]TXD37674.1 biotin/lipoyl-binding protein [Lujinxingia vulgaris]
MAEEVRAHITGTVWKIEVEIGEEVEEDDDLIILESMKMEMPVPAPCDGVVKEILIKEGDAVDEDQVLIIMEES